MYGYSFHWGNFMDIDRFDCDWVNNGDILDRYMVMRYRPLVNGSQSCGILANIGNDEEKISSNIVFLIVLTPLLITIMNPLLVSF